MNSEKVNQLFDNGIKKLKYGGTTAMQEFFDMCARGNLFALPYENQVLVYQQKSDATWLHSFDSWDKHNRVPKRNTAIYLLKNDHSPVSWCFDFKDTLQKPEYIKPKRQKSNAQTVKTEEYQPPRFSASDMDVLLEEAKKFVEEDVNLKDCIDILTRTYVRGIFKTEYDTDIPDNLKYITYALSNYVVLKRMGGPCEIPDSVKAEFGRLDELDLLRTLDYVQLVSSRFIGMVYREMLKRVALEKEGGKEDGRSDGEDNSNRGRNGNDADHDQRGTDADGGLRGSGRTGNRGGNQGGSSQLRKTGSGLHRGEISETRTDASDDGQTQGNRTAETGRRDRADGEAAEGIHGNTSEYRLFGESTVSERSESLRPGDSERGSIVPEPLEVIEEETVVEFELELEEDEIVEDSYAQMSMFDIMGGEQPPAKEPAPVKVVKKEVSKVKNVPMEYLEEAVLHGSGFQHGKFRIEELYKGTLTSKERVEKIKKEYGIGGCGWPMDGRLGLHGYDHDAKGIKLNWITEDGEKEGLVTWTEVEQVIHGFINAGTYITEKEREEKAKDDRRKEEKKLEKLADKGISGAYKELVDNEALSDADRFSKLAFVQLIGSFNFDRYRSALKNVYGSALSFDVKKYFTETFLKNHFQKYSTFCNGVCSARTDIVENHVHINYVPSEIDVKSTDHKRYEVDIDYDTATSIMDSVISSEEYKIIDTLDWAPYMKKVSAAFVEFYNAFAELHGLEILQIAEEDIVRPETTQTAMNLDVEEEEIFDDSMEQEAEAVIDVEYKEIVTIESADEQTMEEIPHSETAEVPVEPVTAEDIRQEIEQIKGTDYFYPEDWQPNRGNDKDRFRKNIEAIRTLKLVERENRPATPEEQEVLSKYVGWGGLANAFDSTRSEWSKEYEDLKELLTETEYASARSTVTDSFYTPFEVIGGVYAALNRMGFQGGNILEPSMGIGNFYNAMPKEMAEKSRLFGVEIDSVSGRIAKLLHPSANIQVTGVEKATLPENFFNAVIGNIPFGDYQVFDPKYKKQNFLIHDYFIAKSIDLLAPGGVLCVVTSKGTMDKRDNRVRKYIAERAELLGAIRLPDTTFKASANTEVTSDILFLKKKNKMTVDEPDWVNLGYTEDGFTVNQYFADHPEMMLGTLTNVSGRFGETMTLAANEERPLAEQILEAVNNLPEDVYVAQEVAVEEAEKEEEQVLTVPADPNIKNYTYGVVDGVLYYRENSEMYKPAVNAKTEARLKSLCNIRGLLRELIDLQLNDCSEAQLQVSQKALNEAYDAFVKEFGLISSDVNQKALREDVDGPLLSSLEEEDKKEKKIVKAKIFSQRTIHPNIRRESADNALEAYNITMNELGYVSINRMLELYPVDFETLKGELAGQIYLNPLTASDENPYEGYESAEEYLSGNVREKLRVAKLYAEDDPRYLENVSALEQVQPKDLEASEIKVRFGTPWIEREDYEKFIYELLDVPPRNRRGYRWGNRHIVVNFEPISNSYNIANKAEIKWYTNNNTVYGTHRMSALEIIEKLLNMQDITVKDRIDNPDGGYYYVVNQKETIAARDKAETIKQKFGDWLFDDLERREKYVTYYNEHFNSEIVREYDGSMLTLPGKSFAWELKPHQKNVVAQTIRGGNSLYAHCVGAGKSFEMTASCMELRRLGLAYKPIIVVPNHLTGQMAAEFMSLYPSANILLTTKKEFEKKKRQKFIAKIATGDYDAIIMGHSQFEKIALSPERKEEYIREEIGDISAAIEQMKYDKNENWTIKQMEAQKKRLEAMLEKDQRDDYKDDLITFEELGIDCVMIDEAHLYKNLSFTTKMSRVAGINPNGSKRAMDLFMKLRYIDELTPNRNVVFATGTPIANSMAEMYVMQKYLQPAELKEKGLYHFDAWAAAFGETVTAMELAPEGGSYRQKTRFSKFVNIPELISMFRKVADVKTIDMLPYIKRPALKDGKYNVIECKKTDEMAAYMDDLVERARKIHEKLVDSAEDNMLKVCHDARLMSADMRLIDPLAENHPDSKLNMVVKHVYEVYERTNDFKGTQAIFCDLGTPNNEGRFCVYDYIKEALIEKGIPAEEICFIHDAGTDEGKKLAMFEKLRSGEMRIIIGSTEKMGTGTNIQERLAALHEIDVPWRPADVEQREGRILRQGNMLDEVEIFRYVTKGTFDAYNWSIIETKQKFISQVMSGTNVGRECEDVDEAVMNYAEMKAISSDNPLIKEKMEVDMEIQKLKMLRDVHNRTKYDVERRLKREVPSRIESLRTMVEEIKADIQARDAYKAALSEEEKASFIIQGVSYDNREDAGEAFAKAVMAVTAGERPMERNFSEERRMVGNYCGFEIGYQKEYFMGSVVKKLVLKGKSAYTLEAGDSAAGNMQRIVNMVDKLDTQMHNLTEKIEQCQHELVQLQKEYEKPFEREEEYTQKLSRQKELEVLLSGDATEEDKEQEAGRTKVKAR